MGQFPESGFPGGIEQLTSTGATVTITNPYGPITNLETGGGSTILTGNGNPNTNTAGGSAAGTLNQLYINLTATGQDDWLWRCSTGGAAGTAVWVGKL